MRVETGREMRQRGCEAKRVRQFTGTASRQKSKYLLTAY